MSEKQNTPEFDQPVGATPPAGSTIPESDTGVAVGYTGEPSTFEPEEVFPTDAKADAAADTAGAEATGGTGPRSTEATGMSGEDLSIFQTHWDEFAGHVD